MNKYLRAITANSFFLVITTIFFLIVTPLALRIMGEEFYGMWVVMVALMFFSNVGNLGVSAIVMKFSSESFQDGEFKQRINQVMTSGYVLVFLMSMATFLILLAAKGLIANSLNTSAVLKEQFQKALFWVALGVFPQFLARVPHGYLLSQLRNWAVRQAEFFSMTLLWLGAIIVTNINKNLEWIGVWCFLTHLLVLGLYIGIVQRLHPFRFQLDVPTLHKMTNFSGFMFLESVAVVVFQQLDRVAVSFILGPVLAGAYSVGTSLALRLTMVTGLATEVMVPYASLRDSLNDHEKLNDVFRQLSRYVSLILAAVASLLVVWMEDLLALWISLDYATRYAGAFRLMIVAYGLLSLCRPAHQTLTGMGKVKMSSSIYMVSSLLMLGGVFYLSQRFGLMGAAAANFALVLLLSFNVKVYQFLGSPSIWRDFFTDLKWGLLIPSLAYAAFHFFLPPIFCYKIIGTVFLAVFFFWVVSRDAYLKEELLPRLLQKFRGRGV
ncbi:MAG: oligosaccharide flippase family protein [Chloroflexi bacterium]|nr:oligosaccharide flippase family protein [Chloroflexota bacterium]